MGAISPFEAEQLCLKCALCCSGAVFTHVELKSADHERLVTAKNDVSADENRLTFPCRFLDGQSCSVYAARPSICSGYRCETLVAAQTGQIALADAQDRIQQAVAHYDSFKKLIPEGLSLADAQKLIQDGAPPHGMTREYFNAMRLAFVTLQTALDRFIRRSDDQVVQSMPAEARN